MYVAVKGGAAAIENSWRLLAAQRRGDTRQPELTIEQIREQMPLAVDRVMTEGSLYDRDLAALALKQACGDVLEAVFLVRAYRTTLPRLATSEPLDTARIRIMRRISATFKDAPGGQVLGPTYDYTHRLIDFTLAASGPPSDPPAAAEPMPPHMPRIHELLAREGLMETPRPDPGHEPGDLTREPLMFPADRSLRLQALARGDEGFLLALGYSTQRGYGRTHPFAGEIRMGEVEVVFKPDELGFEVSLGVITITECEMVNQFKGSADKAPQFTRGYGLTFGHSERKAMSMALVDRALRARELGEEAVAPAQDEEFVLSHCDSVQATGFVEHLKLPHYVDFQAELTLLRQLRSEWDEARGGEAAASSRGEAAE